MYAEPPDISRIAVFHFGHEDKSNPFESLSAKIDESRESLRNSLLVLPEGFNVKGGYCATFENRPPLVPALQASFQELSEELGIAFVVGVLLDEESGRYNLAGLVDSARGSQSVEWLSWKHREPPSAAQPNPSTKPEIIRHRGLAITALICDDFSECNEDDRLCLIGRLSKDRRRVVGVPACSTRGQFSSLDPSAWGAAQIVVAVANGDNRDLSWVRVDEHNHKRLDPADINRNKILVSDPL